MASHKCLLSLIELKGLKQLYVNTSPMVVERIHVTGGTVAAKLAFKCRRKSWSKSRQKSSEFSTLLFKVTSTSFALRFLFLQIHTQPLLVSTVRYCTL
jgi:hypothetical protein